MPKHRTDSNYTISDLRKEFGVTARTLRHYEDFGILAPRREGTHRRYSASDQVRLRLTLRGRRMGLSLAECRDILNMYREPADEAGQITHLIEKISSREAEFEQRRRDINATLRELRRVRASLQRNRSRRATTTRPRRRS